MGRPSRIFISIDSQDGAITRVRVGGRAVLVGRGEISAAAPVAEAPAAAAQGA